MFYTSGSYGLGFGVSNESSALRVWYKPGDATVHAAGAPKARLETVDKDISPSPLRSVRPRLQKMQHIIIIN